MERHVSINEVLERTGRARPDAIEDETKAAWLIELEGRLWRETVGRHDCWPFPLAEARTLAFPEDGDAPLLAAAPCDNVYDLYLFAQADALNREYDNYNNSAALFNAALDAFKREFHRRYMPHGAGGYRF